MTLFGTSDSKISVVAQLRAKSGQEDEVRKALAALVEPSSREPGCLRYSVFEDAHYTGSFFTYEEWESEDALDQHLQTNKAALNKAKSLLCEDLRINVIKPVN